MLLVSLVLMLPAYLINLGVFPLHADEPTRALVALEMMISGNYVEPTINGIPYLNKPPLYNWILAGVYTLSGSVNELWTRIPAVISLLLFGFTIYRVLKNRLGPRIAMITTLAFLTCGRILFYDSMLGLIDILYGWITFVMITSIYIYERKDKKVGLFLIAWGLTGIGFMMKGLPSLVFLLFTLGTWLIATGKWRWLFSWPSLAGTGLFLLMTGTYYYVLSREAGLKQYFITLWEQSVQRTPVSHGAGSTLLHLFIFPFEQIYHLFPWGLLMIALIRKSLIRDIRQHRILVFASLVFLVNLLVYWISPDTRPRYLFPLYPLLLAVMFWNIDKLFREDQFRSGIFRILFPVLILSTLVLPVIAARYPATRTIPGLGPIILVFVPLVLWLAWFSYRRASAIWLSTVVLLFILRIGFDLLVIPARMKESPEVIWKHGALRAGQLSRGHELYFARFVPLSHATSFYLTLQRDSIVKMDPDYLHPGAWYIRVAEDPPLKGERTLYSFETRWKRTRLRMVEFN